MPRAPAQLNHGRVPCGETMTNDYIPQPRPELSDDAAAQVLDFLYDLVTDFESAYANQIRRHHQAQAADHPTPLVHRPSRAFLKPGNPPPHRGGITSVDPQQR